MTGQRIVTAAALWAWAWAWLAAPSAQGHTGVHARCVRAAKPVVVDGRLDEWGAAEAVRVDHTRASFGTTPSDADAGYTFRSLWDENALYLAFDVTDDRLVTDQPGPDLYKADCVEFSIDLGNNSEGAYQPDDFQFVVSPSGPGKVPLKWMYRNPVSGNREPKDLGLAAAIRQDGYVIEVAIPWKSLGQFTPATGSVIGFQHDLRDFDPNEDPAGLCWASAKDPMANPLEWGDLILVDRPNDPVDKVLAAIKPGIERCKRILAGVTAEDDNDVAVEISDKAVGELSLGIGWNWQYIRGDFPDWSPKEWDAFLGMLAWSRPHWVRYGLHMSHWEPENDDNDPDHFEWDRFQFDSDVMKMHYRMLDFCERQGIDVLVCNWNVADWLAETVRNKALKDTDDKTRTDAPYDPKELVESVAALVHQLKAVKKYQCVKYVSLWNEPNGKWSYNSPNANYPDAFWPMYPLLDAKLKAMGLRDQVKILGPDSSTAKYGDLEEMPGLLDRYGDVVDVLADHDYKGYADCEKGKRGAPISEGVEAYARLATALRARKRPIPLGVCEYGNMGAGSSGVQGDAQVFAGSISTAELVTRAASVGVNGFLRWSYAPCHSSCPNWGALNASSRQCIFTPYPPVYYPHSMLSRYIEKGSAVLDAKVTGGIDENHVPRVYASAFKWATNQFTIVLINDGFQPKKVRVSAFPIAFMRFQLSHLSYDARLPETLERQDNVPVYEGKFTLDLPPRSIHVVTSVEKGIDTRDLSLALRLSPPRLDPSYDTIEENGTRLQRFRYGFEQGCAWSVWQSSEGKTTIRATEDMPHSGARSGRVTYDFVSKEKQRSPEHVFLFLREGVELDGPPRRMSLWLFGNESGHKVRIAFLDADGETFQPRQETVVDFAGWRKIEVDLTEALKDCPHWGGDKNGTMDFPLAGVAISITERSDDFSGSGTLFLDDIEITAEAPPEKGK